jgi:hypothetical protein
MCLIKFQSHLDLLDLPNDMLKRIGDKASPSFRPFWIGKLSDKCLPIRTLLYVSFKHILIRLTNFMKTPHSMRIFYNISLLTFFLFMYCVFTIYSRYLKRVVSKRDGCVYLKQVPLKTLLLGEENRLLKRNWPIDLIWGTGDSPLDDSPSRHCNNHNISL